MLDYSLCSLYVHSSTAVNAPDFTLAESLAFILSIEAFFCANAVEIDEV